MSRLFSFLRRAKSEPSAETDDTGVEDTDTTNRVSVPNEEGLNDVELILSRTRFPIKARTDLLRALGGSKMEISVGTKVYLAGEIADRCFANRTIFRSPEEVTKAIQETSWTKVIVGKLHMLPFPVKSKDQLKIKLRGTYIEGVPAIDLIEDLDFPIESPSELLARLAKPRTKPGIASDAPVTLEDNRGENPPDEAISQDNPGEEESSLNHHVQILEETSS